MAMPTPSLHTCLPGSNLHGGSKADRLRSPSAWPNPSFKLRPNGKSPSPVWRYAVHFRQSGLGANSNVRPHANHTMAAPSSSVLLDSWAYLVSQWSAARERVDCQRRALFMLSAAQGKFNRGSLGGAVPGSLCSLSTTPGSLKPGHSQWPRREHPSQ